MNKNTRTKLIATGLLAAAAAMLPACAATNTVAGTAVPSAEQVAAYHDEVTKQPVANTSAPESQADKVSPQYREVVRALERAFKDFDKFITSNYSGDPDITAYVIEDGTEYTQNCRRPDKVSEGWACESIRVAVFDLPKMVTLKQQGGDAGVYLVVAHEFTHILINDLDPKSNTNDNAEELKATCGAGAFIRVAATVNGWDAKDVAKDIDNTLRYQQEKDAFFYGVKNGYDACMSYVEGMK